MIVDASLGRVELQRCGWATSTPDYVAYHDQEWGTPLHGDDALFERLSLEAFQSGLSWLTILRKRPAFRAAFAGFAIDAVAGFGDDDVARLMADAGIVRNRAKVEATLANARAARRLPDGLSALLWSFAPTGPRPNPATADDVPAITAESTAMARALKTAGFRFVGPTTAHALMQATGMVDDHVAGCFRAGDGPLARGLMLVQRPRCGRMTHSSGSARTDSHTAAARVPRVAGEGGTHGGHEAAHG